MLCRDTYCTTLPSFREWTLLSRHAESICKQWNNTSTRCCFVQQTSRKQDMSSSVFKAAYHLKWVKAMDIPIFLQIIKQTFVLSVTGFCLSFLPLVRIFFLMYATVRADEIALPNKNKNGEILNIISRTLGNLHVPFIQVLFRKNPTKNIRGMVLCSVSARNRKFLLYWATINSWSFDEDSRIGNVVITIRCAVYFPPRIPERSPAGSKQDILVCLSQSLTLQLRLSVDEIWIK